MKYLMVTGSRTWHKVGKMKEELKTAYSYLGKGNITLVHGDCPDGADAIADLIWANQFGREFIEKYPPDLKKHGKRGYAIRNQAMVDSKPDLVLAFMVDSSPGTQMTINFAKKANLEVNIFEDFLVPPF